ncbi:MAG: hypothetical protein HRU20_15830 [Pseudomonadales bacterium]|nr:hypothetical protein [Pseudomonadales bacterium]
MGKIKHKPKKNNIGQLNAVQLNIVTIIDVYKALQNNSLDNCVYMVDNTPEKLNTANAELRTTCRQGQVINWIVYPLDMEPRVDNEWPSFPKIVNIVFLNEYGDNVSELKVCSECNIYGAPDKIRTPYALYDMLYLYWAGIVVPDLRPGTYKYRIIFELQPAGEGKKAVYFNLDSPSLQVIELLASN